MKLKKTPLAVLTVLAIAGPASAATLLLSDNFNDAPNESVSTFNSNLASTQSGTLATVSYTIQGTNYVSQHSNSGRLLVATSIDGNGNGSVSLNNNFATQANTANLPLQITFNIVNVTDYSDTTKWVQFNVGSSQNLDVANAGAAVGALFRVNGGGQILSAGSALVGASAWTANDLVTITLTDTAGTGSAFNGNGSNATISIGATNYGTFALAQQTSAYLTFSGYNYGSEFGVGTFDNLSVTLIPEPHAALLGGLGLMALLRRRR